MTDDGVELRITRTFDAPRDVVFRAFTDPDQLAQWFGPAGWSVPRETVSIDLRIGGEQQLTMVNDTDPSQTSVVHATFTEVIENELLVGSENVPINPDGSETRAFTLRLEFHDDNGGTRLELTQGPFPPDWAGPARQGWGSSFGKLDALLGRN